MFHAGRSGDLLLRLRRHAAKELQNLFNFSDGGGSDKNSVVAGQCSEDGRMMQAVKNLSHTLRPAGERFDHDKRFIRVDALYFVADERLQPSFLALRVQYIANAVSRVHARNSKLFAIARERRLRNGKSLLLQSPAKLVLTVDRLMGNDLFEGKLTTLLVHGQCDV